MSRKDKKRMKSGPPREGAGGSRYVLSKRGWIIVGVGIGVVTMGFIVLGLTDPRGQNFASQLSPFLLIGGYALIAVGIVTKDPSEASPPAPNSPSEKKRQP